MVSIDERITDHEILIKKLNDKKYILESKLNNINKKLIFHYTAICNLEIKKSKNKDGETNE